MEPTQTPQIRRRKSAELMLADAALSAGMPEPLDVKVTYVPLFGGQENTYVEVHTKRLADVAEWAVYLDETISTQGRYEQVCQRASEDRPGWMDCDELVVWTVTKDAEDRNGIDVALVPFRGVAR